MSVRQEIEDYVINLIKTSEPSGVNEKRYRDMFKGMSDAAFDTWINNIEAGIQHLEIYAPNMVVNLNEDDQLAAAKLIGVNPRERIYDIDPATKRRYLTPHKYFILSIYVRRLKQTVEDKRSVPASDQVINQLTGQVLKPDKGSSVSTVEATVLLSKDLVSTLEEFTNVRGGNIPAYAKLKADILTTGRADLSPTIYDTRPRSVSVLQAYFDGMQLDINLTGGDVE